MNNRKNIQRKEWHNQHGTINFLTYKIVPNRIVGTKYRMHDVVMAYSHIDPTRK